MGEKEWNPYQRGHNVDIPHRAIETGVDKGRESRKGAEALPRACRSEVGGGGGKAISSLGEPMPSSLMVG